MTEKLDKGALSEEVLRDYFLSQGFYVVRGARVIYGGFDVTDVDLFVYSRPSSLTRERGNVDIKKRRTPQAFERILWSKGLMSILGFERCFVATTDHRAEVVAFGAAHDVIVLDGMFVSRLPGPQGIPGGVRLSEEEILHALEEGSVGKLGGDWKGKYEISKARVISDGNFDNANACLNDTKQIIEAMAVSPSDVAARRFTYIVVSHLLLILDYLAASLPLVDADGRKRFFEDGFRYGNRGKRRAEEIIGLTSSLASSLGGRYRDFGYSLKDEMLAQYALLPVQILAEFFAKGSTLKAIFEWSVLFERCAFSRETVSAGKLSNELQGVLGLLCDFHGIDRKKVLL